MKTVIKLLKVYFIIIIISTSIFVNSEVNNLKRNNEKKEEKIETRDNHIKTDTEAVTNNKNKNNITAPKIQPPVARNRILPEHLINSDMPINYYYPYFHKTRIIQFRDNILDYNSLIVTCADPNCFYCNGLFPDECKKCATGYFLTANRCEEYCPEGYLADVLREKCVPVLPGVNDVYTSKAYSIGSCKNMCGKGMVMDCSCLASCKSSGNCCTDYNVEKCDYIIDKANISAQGCKEVEGCDLCDNISMVGAKLKCNQCSDNYYLYKGQCFRQCPADTDSDYTNKICKDRQGILV